jgi:hypothetical protein
VAEMGGNRFPEAIGLAATWDPNLLLRVAQPSETKGARISCRPKTAWEHPVQMQGLTFWSPNINIFDPRGRGQDLSAKTHTSQANWALLLCVDCRVTIQISQGCVRQALCRA